jgi:hypothetical protein
MSGGLPSDVNAPGRRPRGRSPGYAFSDRLAPEPVIGLLRNQRSAWTGTRRCLCLDPESNQGHGDFQSWRGSGQGRGITGRGSRESGGLAQICGSRVGGRGVDDRGPRPPPLSVVFFAHGSLRYSADSAVPAG